MSLRKMLGGDVDRVHEQVDALLDREDAMIVLIDSSRAITYANGFGISPSQHELLALDIERAVRTVAGPVLTNSTSSTDTRNAPPMRGDSTGARQGRLVRGHLGGVQHGRRPEMNDVRESGRHRVIAESESASRAVRVLRLAGQAAGADAPA
jgi:hypothetical protein